MKFYSILSAVFLLFFSHSSFADIRVSSWQEVSSLNSSGKNSEILVKAKAENIPLNQVLTSFTIGFSDNQNIRITKVICDDKIADFSFVNNLLKIKFPQGKSNKQALSLYFAYEEKYDLINQYLRQEAIYVPAFAAGADARVVLIFPGYLESATLNPNIIKSDNSFIYSNKVPQDGVQEIIKLTEAENIWNVAVKISAQSNQSLGKIILNIPQFFVSNHQKIVNNNITSSLSPIEQKNEGSEKILTFKTEKNLVTVNSNAKIITGAKARGQVARNPADYLKVTSEEQILLWPILQRISQDSKYGAIPLYAKIGRFVHDYLKYDLSYLGKLPSLSEIMQKRTGVCTEYARLFDALARLAKIPSMVIDGGACGEYQKCQGHSWNMIFYNGKWIEVDPTWNLLSGIVSSSHVYFNDAGKGDVGVKYFDRSEDLKIKIDLEMKNISQISQ